MGMKQLTGKRLSTSLVDTDDYPARTLIRVSVWVDPSDVEVTEDVPERPTIGVTAYKGRTIVYGTIDRDAWTELTARANADKPFTTKPIDLEREKMYRR